MAREQLKNLTEPMYYILLSLIKENHGYGIMQMVEEITEGRVVIGAGTLYSLLGRFEKEEIITQLAEENRRKTYIITEKGNKILKDEYERLNLLVSDGKRFFDFDGERKDPPNDGGGENQEAVEEAVTEIIKEEKKKKEKRVGRKLNMVY
ncbi:DNA-binding PadR family transcriptional regulator [Clostridiales Family XIII bacterium PM5-7]